MVNYVAAHGIRSLPIYLRDIVNAKIAIRRIERVLRYDDSLNYIVLTTNSSNSIELKDATLAWDSYAPHIKNKNSISEDPSKMEAIVQRTSTLSSRCLFDLNVEIPNAKHIGIIGSVGSGKTAFLLSILGQMRLISGKVGVKGSVAYVSQEPWIVNTSIRDNIVFGYPFNERRYYEAINYCALNNDISSLMGSDQTEVGERGVNLSGGQKQRISLSRAYYSNKDIYLLDDPLSSVDQNVGRHIFNNCITKGLRDKTVLMVSHQKEYLEKMDFVIFIRDGHIVNTGVHNHLYNSDEDYKQLIDSSKISSESVDNAFNRIEESKDDENDLRFSSPDWSDVKPLPLDMSGSESSLSQVIDIESTEKSQIGETLLSGRLIFDEKLESGNISWDTYQYYLSAGGGIAICSFVIGWLVLQAMASSFANWWLGYWISQGSGNVCHLSSIFVYLLN